MPPRLDRQGGQRSCSLADAQDDRLQPGGAVDDIINGNGLVRHQEVFRGNRNHHSERNGEGGDFVEMDLGKG